MTSPEICLIIANIMLTSLVSITARIAMGRMDPIPYAVLSLAITGACLAAVEARAGRLNTLLDPRYAKRFLAIGFFGATLPSLLLFHAGQTVPASRMVILCQVEILIAQAFGFFLLKETVGPRQLGAIALILAGMLTALGAEGLPTFGRGEAMVLAMPLTFQLSHLAGKSLSRELPPDSVAGGRSIYGLVLLLPLIPLFRSDWGACLRPQSLAILVFQGLVLNALSLALWYRSLARIDLSKLTPLILTYPLLTLAIARVLPGLREPVGARQFAGAAVVIVGGAILSRLPSSRREAADAAAG